MQIRTKDSAIVEIEVEEGVDVGFGLKDSLFLDMGGEYFIVQRCVSGRHHLAISTWVVCQ